MGGRDGRTARRVIRDPRSCVTPLRNSAGFSLTEALVSLAAGLAVLGAAFEALTHFQATLSVQHRAMARTQDVRLGLAVLEAEVRLAGAGALRSAPGLVRAESEEIEFHANLGGLTTTLTEAAGIGQQDVAVASGSGWPKGKHVVICGPERCAEHRLSRDGRSRALSFTSPLTEAFPVGSALSVSNLVRYYLRSDQEGKTSLMRMVDGGANPLIGEVKRFCLSYLDGSGRPTRTPSRVSRVRIELGTDGAEGIITREVGLRSL